MDNHRAAGTDGAGCWIFVQHVGISLEHAEVVIRRFATHSSIPQPLRAAHLIAGAIATGRSGGRV